MFKTPIIIISKRITKILSWIVPVYGITIWPFIILSPNANNEITINHETIHIKQYEETFIIGFYLIYIFVWIYNYIKTGDAKLAYYSIRFEKEAYQNHANMNYLEERKPMAWKYYV